MKKLAFYFIFISIIVLFSSCKSRNSYNAECKATEELKESITTDEVPVALNLTTDIFGLQLGVTSPEDGKTILLNKGYKLEQIIDAPSLITFSLVDVRFGGIKWEHNVFRFYNNKLMLVAFGNKCGMGDADKIYNSLVPILKKKYSKFIESETTDQLIFTQNDFSIKLKKSYDYIILGYTDEKLLTEQEADEKAQL